LAVQLVKHEAPLSDEAMHYVTEEVLQSCYAEAVKTAERAAGMTDEDLELWERISDLSSPEVIARQSAYYCLATVLTAYGRRLLTLP